MKLEPKAKPVRIRIKSGGEEHSTLESLKRNFSVDDLKTAVEDRRLSRWLKQQGQNELAEGVLRYQGKMKSLSGNDYLGFIKLFFANEPGIEKVKDDCSLAGFFHDKKMEKNFDRVFNRCCESKSYAIVYDFYSTFKGEKTADFWIERFERLIDSLESKDQAKCQYNLAILYGKRNLPYNQIKCLCESIELGNEDAKKVFRIISDKYDFPKGVKAFIEKHVPNNEKDEFLNSLIGSYRSLGQKDKANELLQSCKEASPKKSERIAVDYTKSSVSRLSQILNEDMKEYNEQCLKLAESHLSIEKADYLKLCAKYISIMIKYINRCKGVSYYYFKSYYNDIFKSIRIDFQYIKNDFNVDDSLHQFLCGLCYEYVSGSDAKYPVSQAYKLSSYRINIDRDRFVTASNGYSCLFPKKIDLQSFIQMALFAMETRGMVYEFTYQI